MTHLHVHNNDNMSGTLYVTPDGKVQGDNAYARVFLTMMQDYGLEGEDLLNAIEHKLDPALMVGTHRCDDPSHVPSQEPEWETGNVNPAPDDNWDKYQGEDEKNKHEVSFGNDTMWLN